ncbi:MAG: hypothetical protein RL732_1353, partial [Bacteroidota bacterium]
QVSKLISKLQKSSCAAVEKEITELIRRVKKDRVVAIIMLLMR